MSAAPIALFIGAIVLLFLTTRLTNTLMLHNAKKAKEVFERDIPRTGSEGAVPWSRPILRTSFPEEALLLRRINIVMTIALSILLLVGSFYIILATTFDSGEKKWGFATIGAIVGFWLKH